MEKFKKILIFALVTVLLVSLCSCVYTSDREEKGDDSAIESAEECAGKVFRNGVFIGQKDGKTYYFTKDNEPAFTNVEVYGANSTYTIFVGVDETNNICGYYDATGKSLLGDCKYEAYDETIGIYLTVRDPETLKIGYCDLSGNVVIEPQFDDATWFSFANCDLCAVEIDGKWGYIDKTGKIVIEPQFASATNFDKVGVAVVGNAPKYGSSDKKYALINTSGELLTDYIFNYISNDYINGFTLFIDGQGVASIDKQYCIIDVDGNVIEYIPDNMYVWLENLPKLKRLNGKTIFRDENTKKYGVKDADGNILVDATFGYLSVSDFDYDYFIGCKDNHYAIYDYTGKVIFGENEQYTSIDTYDDYIVVKKDGKCGAFDWDGNLVIPFEYSDLEIYVDYIVARKDLLNTPSNSSDDVYGIIDFEGNIVIPFEYENIYCYD